MPRLTPATIGSRSLRAVGLIAAILLWVSIQAPGAHAARGLDLGFYDGEFASDDSTVQTTALSRASQAGARIALIYADWSGVAPSSRPADATNPAVGYKWDSLDAAVRDATARGMTVLMGVAKAPSWAEGPNRPSTDKALPGTWDPNPADLGDFARALATRYSGRYLGLPAVRYYQLWAEPNLAVNLGPQFIGNTPVGFEIYRGMLNAFYSGIKAVSPQSQVVTGGTAPYGGLTPAHGLAYQRMQPLTFWRGLLCEPLGKKKKKKKRKGKRRAASAVAGCTPPRFDIAAHHPINVGAPTRHALNANDASTPDIGRLRRVLRRGVGNKPIWATEIWWNSKPPGRGVRLKTQARYLQQSFYLLWKQHVPVAVWFEVRDAQPDPSTPTPTCGVFFRDGRPKPSLQAFRFPLVVERIGGARVRVWGMAPQAGPVSILRRGHQVKKLTAGANRVFVGRLHVRRAVKLRAVQGSERSLVAPEFTAKKRR